jgi:hypothetical protein
MRLDISSSKALRASKAGKTPEDIFAALMAKDENGCTLLHDVAKKNDPDLMGDAIEGLTAAQLTKLLMEENDYCYTPLNSVADIKNPGLIKAIVNGFLDVKGGEAAFKQLLNYIKAVDNKLFREIVDLMSKAFGHPTPEKIINISLKAAKDGRKKPGSGVPPAPSGN